MFCFARSVIGKTLSRMLASYYRGPNHPMKLRVWRHLRQLLRYAPLTVPYGQGGWITVDEREWLQSRIFAEGAYEPEVWQALAQHASSAEVVWDVGAYVGSFALLAAQDPRVACVCAFEPDPLTLTTLGTNLALNGNPVRVYPLALSDSSETKTLVRGPAVNTGMSTLCPSANTGILEHASTQQLPTFDVICRTADELVAHGAAPAPTLMKIDVEGWEYRVLSGARRIIQSPQVRAMVFETSCDESGAILDNRLERLLSSSGFAISHISRPGGELRDVENYLGVRK
jgi:FkbM family methyltransferase